MCKHQYTTKLFQAPDTCYMPEFYNQFDINPTEKYVLPIDSDGFCLFHSQNKDWKVVHNFEEQLDLLLKYHLANEAGIEEIDFRDFFFVTENDNAIVWSDLVVSKPINICGATFQTNFTLEKSKFIGNFFMDSAHFYGDFLVISCEFFGNFTAVDKTTFHRSVQMSEVNFVGFYEVRKAHFLGQVHFSEITFQGHSLWDFSIFDSGNEGINYFHFKTNDYTSFKKVHFVDIAQFEQCIFNGDTHFDEAKFDNAFFFTKPTINSSIFFKGNKNEMIFQNEVQMELDDQSFKNSGQIVFEYANLINLDNKTKKQLTQLKINRKIELGKGTIVYRISFQEKYAYNNFDDIFLRDLLATIQQYFQRKLSKHFEFVLSREGAEIIATFYTDDYANPDDFKREAEKIKDDLVQNIHKIVDDVVINYLKGKFKYEIQSMVKASIDQKISGEFISQLIDNKSLKLILNNPEISTKRLEISTVKNTSIYVENLTGLKNDPTFKMNDKQFQHIKNQLLTLENEKWEHLMNIVKEIKNHQENEDKLLSFLSETGISIANNTSAAIIFLLINSLL